MSKQAEHSITAKSIRLNKEIRETILGNIKGAWIKANPAPMYSGESTSVIISDCVIKMYEARTKDLRELINATPRLRKAISMSGHVYVQTPTGTSMSVVLPKDSEGTQRNFIASECINHNFENTDEVSKSPDMRKAVSDFNKAKKTTREFNQVKDAWSTKLTNYMEQCRQVIYGVNTTAQLIEVWAELAPFIPVGYRNPSYINLPAIDVKSLNDALKVESKAKCLTH